MTPDRPPAAEASGHDVTLSGAAYRILGLLIANGAVQALAAAALVLGVRTASDVLHTSAAIAPETVVLLMGAVCTIVVLRFREIFDGERLGQTVAHDTRLKLSRQLMRLPSRSKTSSGDVLLRFVGDLTALRTWYAKGLVNVIVGVPVVLAGLLAIGFFHPLLALTLAAITALALGIQIAVSARLRAAAEVTRDARGRLAADVVERIDTLASVQLFGRTGAEQRRIERRSTALGEALQTRAYWSGLLRASAEAAALLTPLLVIALWSWSAARETATLSIGDGLTAMTVGAIVAARLRGLGRVLEHWTLAQISRDRVREFLTRQALAERPDDRNMNRKAGRLALKKLSLAGVFDRIEAVAEPGARIALVGANGAGKSRLLGVIAGLEEATGGKVVIDRQDAGKRRLGSLRRLVAMASAEARLLRGTVEMNIRYGARARPDTAARLLAMGGYDAFLDELPNGGKTRVGVGGKGLSLGQQQRVGLLRALLRDPLILLLDEVDAHLDSAGQATLDRVFDGFAGGVIMATHNEDWIARCDTIWRLENGRLTVETPAKTEVRRHG